MTQTQQDTWKSKRAAALEIGCTYPKLERLLKRFSLETRADVMNDRVQLVNVSELKRRIAQSA